MLNQSANEHLMKLILSDTGFTLNHVLTNRNSKFYEAGKLFLFCHKIFETKTVVACVASACKNTTYGTDSASHELYKRSTTFLMYLWRLASRRTQFQLCKTQWSRDAVWLLSILPSCKPWTNVESCWSAKRLSNSQKMNATKEGLRMLEHSAYKEI